MMIQEAVKASGFVDIGAMNKSTIALAAYQQGKLNLADSTSTKKNISEVAAKRHKKNKQARKSRKANRVK